MSVQTMNNGLLTMLERFGVDVPTRSRIKQFAIGTGQADPTVSDTDLTTKVLFNTTEGFYKDFDSISLDSAKKELTLRGTVADTECNGASINASAASNTDTTPLQAFAGTITAIDKTTSKRVIVIFRVRLRTEIEVTE